MPYTQIEIDALKAAIATGARVVKYADKEVTYDSLEKMLERLRLMENAVNPVTPNLGSRRYGSYFKNRC